MAAIVNDRDVLLQAASTRFVMPQIAPDRIPGLVGAINDVSNLKDDVLDLEEEVGFIGEQVLHMMNTSDQFVIRASALTFFGLTGSPSPLIITLAAERGSGLVGGTVAWSVFAGAGTVTPMTGETTSVLGSTVTGNSITVRARLTIGAAIYDAYVTIGKHGAVAASDQVDLATQVTGSLAAGNITGLGALAMLNSVNLNTQTVGALNGLTQVTNLGNLAYANAIAANQIGAGTLAAGVVYAGEINAEQVTAGIMTGRTIRTSATYPRVTIDHASNTIAVSEAPGSDSSWLQPGRAIFTSSGGVDPTLLVTKTGSSGSAPSLRVVGPTGGHGLIVALPVGGSSASPLRLDASASLPTSRAEGSICYYGGWLCFANGTHWFKADGTQLT